jgi:hypothetical protein
MDIRQAAAAFVIVVCILGICALLVGAVMAGRRAWLQQGADDNAVEDWPRPVRTHGSRPDALPYLDPLRSARVYALRRGYESRLVSRQEGASSVLSLPVKTRLDRAQARYQHTRGVVQPFGVDGDVA